MSKSKETKIAEVAVTGVGKMTKEGRRLIANWLRSRAAYIEKHGDLVTDGVFRQRYMVTEAR